MYFELLSELADFDTITGGKGLRQRARLRKSYGPGRWRKRKGTAMVRLEDGTTVKAELHWYEAHGIGRREMKIKRILES